MSDVEHMGEQRSAIVKKAGRGSGGRFEPPGEKALPRTKRDTAVRKKTRTERDYLRRMIETFTLDDIEEMCRAVKADAISSDDPKTTNAARELLFRALLGGGKVALSEVENPPAIVKRR